MHEATRPHGRAGEPKWIGRGVSGQQNSQRQIIMFLKESKSPKDDVSAETKASPTHSTRKALEDGGSTAAVTKASGVPSIISADLKIVGNLKSSGDIQFDGTIEGDIDSRSVVVGQGAKVDGIITAETVRISGAVNGQIKAKSVTLDRTAEVVGDVIHESLTMEAGAFLEGGVRRMEGHRDSSEKVETLRAGKAGSGQEPKLSEVQSKSA